MKILAIDTSTNVASTAVLTDEKLVYENIVDDKLNHSQNLLPTLDLMLENIGLGYGDFDYYAITIGPGSFTGLRIGLSTVKGLSQATGIKIIPATTLETLAYNIAYSNGLILPVLDARQNRYYAALYKSDGMGEIVEVESGRDIKAEGLLELVGNRDVYLLGDGAEKFLSETDFDKGILVKSYLRSNQAASLAQYAITHTDKAMDFHAVAPLYLRGTYVND